MSDEPAVSTQAADGQEHLQRNLKNRHIQLIAIGGAIGTGLFMGSGKTISLAGPSLLLIYVIIGTMLFFVMRAMGELLLHNLEYKSFQDFARDMLGPWAGFFAGWTYWVLWVVTASAEIIAIAGYFDFWIHPDQTDAQQQDLTLAMICTFVLLMALLGCNLLTVKLFGEIEFWFALIKIVAILLLIAVGIWMIITQFQYSTGDGVATASVAHLWDHGGFFPTGTEGFLAGFQIAVFAFIGIELIGTAAAETSDPNKTLPKAINAIPVRIVIFYVLSLAVIMSVTPWENYVKDPSSPFVGLFRLIGITAAAGVMNFVVLTSASSSSNSGIFSTSRMLYGLSLAKQAPESFGHLSKRKVPAKALLLSVACTLIAFPVLMLGKNVVNAFVAVSSVSVGLVLFMWSLILVCYIRYRKLHPEAHKNAAFKMPGASFMPWVVLVFFVFILGLLLWFDDTRIPVSLTFPWFIGLTIAWFIRRRKRGGIPRSPMPHLDSQNPS